jgi:membrane-bound inhibitor of C-type lysozyme
MTKNILTFATVALLLLTSFKETTKQESTEITTTQTVENDANNIITTTSTDKDGKKIEISFNNTKGTATIDFNGETIELAEQRSASGIWYKNENYELRGKGNDVELKKDGKVVFEHEDDIVISSLKDKDGHTLDMTFNNTTNQVKVYLNGGEQIELAGQKAASGIWYKNDQYELRGKGENVELTKDGKIVFKK